MLSYDPPRHPSENLLSYKDEVRGRVWSLSPFPRPPAIGVDPRGAHPTHTSIQRVPGEVSVHLLAGHFPSLPMSGFAPVGHAERCARMKQSSYGEPDYAFGQAMLSLRTAIGLTQAGLAEFLSVSRKAVGGWEPGCSYPT